ncbi:MAG: exodeoxyribonuclease III [Cyclobacteriaceae bacterium]
MKKNQKTAENGSFRVVTWNVNGIRSIAKKDFFTDLKLMNPDVLCLQETKAAAEEVVEVLDSKHGYHVFANSSKARKGYSGTAILTREQPVDVLFDMGVGKHDQEGRVIAAEYSNFFVVSVYVPNSGEGLARLDYRTEWDKDFNQYLKWLDRRKPVLVCGDFNVAHQAIDIARPKENYNKSAGYTQKEIDGFTELLGSGFEDTFRQHHPDEVKYTYWNYWMNAREKNIGWRIDYVLVSSRFSKSVREAFIMNELKGSDHCPAGIDVVL